MASYRFRTAKGFTLLEIVLAMGLTVVVLALLTTAINSYLLRVDASRSRVESAQLARSLLNQIARDLRAARYESPPAADSGSANPGPSTSSTPSDSSAPETTSAPESSTVSDNGSTVSGIYGTATELRIDRAAPWRWERLSRESAPPDAATSAEMPQTVRYFLNDGSTLLSTELAATGIGEQSPQGYAGLCRQQLATAAWIQRHGTSISTSNQDDVELLAPEVMEIEFAYFDGQQLVDAWDSAESNGLPRAVEIRLKIVEEPFEFTANHRNTRQRSLDKAVEYRLLVHIPNVQPSQRAAKPRPVKAEQNQAGNRSNESSPK